jgi:RNA polymerase subunit RPABC4/transcription elongation factor Spt4
MSSEGKRCPICGSSDHSFRWHPGLTEALVIDTLEAAASEVERLGEAKRFLDEARDLEMRAPSRHDFEAYGLTDYIKLVDQARVALADERKGDG